MERRIITTEATEEDVRIETTLRPQCLEDYIGQDWFWQRSWKKIVRTLSLNCRWSVWKKETKPMSNTKKLFSQIIKFGFVGGTAFVIDAGLLFLLTEFCGIHYLISGMISFTASVIYNYILSVKWVFDAKKDANKTQEFIVFIVLSVIGLGINQLFMWLFVDMMHIYYMLSKIIATVIVMVYNFITRKIFLEKK